MTQDIRENYAIAVRNLHTQNGLKDELYTEAPTELRSKTLQSIYKRIKHFETLITSYELVAEDLCISLTEPDGEHDINNVPP